MLLLCFLSVRYLSAQDSLYYSVLWKPEAAYRKAGVREEGVFLYVYKNEKLLDSLLVQARVYDSLGRLVREKLFVSNRLRTRRSYHYTGYQLDSMVQEEPWLPATVVHKYSYDAAGNLLLEQTFNRGRRTTQTRNVYNAANQLTAVYTQWSDEKEFRAIEYRYRPDRLIQQIDYFFREAETTKNYSLLYTYADGGRTATRSYQRAGDDRRYIDCIRTYDGQDRLIETVRPPLRRASWLPPYLGHGRQEEYTETCFYLENGLLSEVHTFRNGKLTGKEKHLYFYEHHTGAE